MRPERDNAEQALLAELGLNRDELLPAAEPPAGFADAVVDRLPAQGPGLGAQAQVDSPPTLPWPATEPAQEPIPAPLPTPPARPRVWLALAAAALLLAGGFALAWLLAAPDDPARGAGPPASTPVEPENTAPQAAAVAGSAEEVPAEPRPEQLPQPRSAPRPKPSLEPRTADQPAAAPPDAPESPPPPPRETTAATRPAAATPAAPAAPARPESTGDNEQDAPTEGARSSSDAERAAQGLYEQAYVIKRSRPLRAMALCREVMGMVDRENIYQRKCRRLIEQIESARQQR
jgi:hypothetical protein